MACFLVPTAVGVVTTLLQKISERSSRSREIKKRFKINLLNTMIWGGVVMLAIEHIAHGEVVPWPPFLTAMRSPQDTASMIHEMTTVGTSMTLAIFLVWIAMITVYPMIVYRRYDLPSE